MFDIAHLPARNSVHDNLWKKYQRFVFSLYNTRNEPACTCENGLFCILAFGGLMLLDLRRVHGFPLFTCCPSKTSRHLIAAPHESCNPKSVINIQHEPGRCWHDLSTLTGCPISKRCLQFHIFNVFRRSILSLFDIRSPAALLSVRFVLE